MFNNISKQAGVESFLTSFTKSKMKSSTMTDDQYLDWLSTFRFIQNDPVTVALRAVEGAIEIHYTSNGDANPKACLRAFKDLLTLLPVNLVTYITEKDKKLIRFMCKFGFQKKWVGFTELDGIQYRRFKLTKEE
ncbi:hypothetical protein [Vibrio breoganii]|uniref:hypothetical protein n=1 Tax=Vibrio breoganii TaxID=553239 RepID=UPI000C82B016|nr:hypothetical protein [Vibrio breoganii]PMM20304.1 hypothetical protein BCT59_07700 [Vibrio breoganii]